MIVKDLLAQPAVAAGADHEDVAVDAALLPAAPRLHRHHAAVLAHGLNAGGGKIQPVMGVAAAQLVQ